MNSHPRQLLALCVVAAATAAGVSEASAQGVACATTTPVVAYQPVVVPTSPAAITGWYPGKLLDRWAANRAAYRDAAYATATAAYRPIMNDAAVTSYRPFTSSLFQSSYRPVRLWRPLMQSTAATTAYYPGVTSYYPAASSTVCDPCSTATVSGYGAASDCCGVSPANTPYDGGTITPIPELSPRDAPYGAGYRDGPTNGSADRANGASGGNTGDGSAAGSQGQEESRVNQNEDQEGTPNTETGFEAPGLYVPGLEDASEPQDRITSRGQSAVVPAVYREKVRPSFTDSRQSKEPIEKRNLPSRAERDAGWTAVTD